MQRRIALAAVLTSALATSCFAVTDLNRFGKPAPVTSNFSDLKLTVRGMTSHVNELVEYRVVDGSNVIQSRGLLKPLGGVNATVFAKGAVPKLNGPFRLDFYADHDNSGNYNVLRPDQVNDHAWRLPLTDAQLNEEGVFDIIFDHNTSFTFLDDQGTPREIGKAATVRLKNMGGFAGKRVEVRIADASSQRVVALYRVPALTTPELDATVPGMVEPGVTYAVEVYTDDGTGAPASVRAFRFDQAATEGGLDATFDPGAPGVTPVNDALPP